MMCINRLTYIYKAYMHASAYGQSYVIIVTHKDQMTQTIFVAYAISVP